MQSDLKVQKEPEKQNKKGFFSRLGMLILIAFGLYIAWRWLGQYPQQAQVFLVQLRSGPSLATNLHNLGFPLGPVVWTDLAFIPVYAAVLAYLKTWLLAFAESRRGLSPVIGQRLAQAGAMLYCGDLAENLLTATALWIHSESNVLLFAGPTLAKFVGAASWLATIVKSVGGVAVIVLLITVVVLGCAGWLARSAK